MTAPTHISFAEFVYLLLLTTTGIPLSAANACTVAFSAVLPDLDNGGSRIGRAFPCIALPIERTFGHRTLTHSVFFIAALGILLLPVAWWDTSLYVCFLTGYASHPFLDTMTVNGTRLFYPVSMVRCVFPMEVNHPCRYRTQTGSKVDRILGVIFLAGCIPTFLIAEQGYERFIRFTQRNIESAVRDYNEFSRTNIVYAEIRAHNLLTKEQLAGRFEVLGTLDPHTLVFRDAHGALHSLGSEYHAEYAAEAVVCQKGEGVRTTVRQVDMQNQLLSQLLPEEGQEAEEQYFGELATADHFSLPGDGSDFSSVAGSQGKLRFSFASCADIRRLHLEDLFIERGVLTVRTLRRAVGGMTGTLQTTGSEEATGAGGGAGRPRPAAGRPFRFMNIAFQVNLRDPVEFLREKGDTVASGEVLARWGELLLLRSEIDLIARKMAAADDEEESRMRALRMRVFATAERARLDSLEHAVAWEMYRKGFLSPAAVSKAAGKMASARQELAAGMLEMQTLRRQCQRELQDLEAKAGRLLLRQRAHRARSEARAPAAGVIVGVHRVEQGEKLRVSIVLRSL